MHIRKYYYSSASIFSRPLLSEDEQKAVKRLIDICISTTILLLLIPVLLLVAASVKLTSKGPILYTSTRIGKNGIPFKMYKFRTMRVNADKEQDTLRQQAELKGELFKIKNDPRITPVGKFLRGYSLDEFPQILNVLKGDMSIIGPRPLPPDESEMFEGPYTRRFEVLPGITGLWQVSGRSKLNFNQMCKLEFTYVCDWSLTMDLKILLKTIPVVLAKSGAY